MERNYSSSRIIQDLSTFIASIIPILQLFFAKLPTEFNQIFFASDKFTIISVVTLVISYMVIIAFQAKPYFKITLPFQKKKAREYEDYLRQANEVSAASNFVVGEQASVSKLNQFINKLEIKVKDAPRKLERDNIISVGLTLLILNSFLFIGVSFFKENQFTSLLQSLNYIFIITSAVMVLAVYRNTVQNSINFRKEELSKTDKAIELATKHLVFGELPQVRLIESFESGNFPRNLNLVVESNGKYYQLVTNTDATRLWVAKEIKNFNDTLELPDIF